MHIKEIYSNSDFFNDRGSLSYNNIKLEAIYHDDEDINIGRTELIEMGYLEKFLGSHEVILTDSFLSKSIVGSGYKIPTYALDEDKFKMLPMPFNNCLMYRKDFLAISELNNDRTGLSTSVFFIHQCESEGYVFQTLCVSMGDDSTAIIVSIFTKGKTKVEDNKDGMHGMMYDLVFKLSNNDCFYDVQDTKQRFKIKNLGVIKPKFKQLTTYTKKEMKSRSIATGTGSSKSAHWRMAHWRKLEGKYGKNADGEYCVPDKTWVASSIIGVKMNEKPVNKHRLFK